MTIFTPRPQWIVDLINELAGGSGGVWGSITGTLSSQTDLQTALDAKVDEGAITSSGLTMATDRLLGRDTSGTGAIEELTVGGGLSIVSGALSVSSSGGILSGTSFPVSPASGDRFYRTDRNIDYFYNGTRWLSTQLFTQAITGQEVLLSQTATTVGEAARIANPWNGVCDIWLETAAFLGFVGGVGSWSIGLHSKTGSSAKVSIANSGNFTTANTSDLVRVAVNAVQASTIDEFNIAYTENSGSVGFYGSCTLIYRLIG